MHGEMHAFFVCFLDYSGQIRKKETPRIQYTAMRSSPSYQFVEPSCVMDLDMNTATAMAASSIVVKTISIVLPEKKLTNTRMGATNKAICRLLPTAISTAAPILFFMASRTAALCSAAFPIMATRKAPTNTSLKPN